MKLALFSVTAFSVMLCCSASYPETGAKGPVGWEVYRQLNRLPEMTPGVKTLQFSSYDRTGGNNDGFEGTYSCIRQTSAGCVIAETTGPGEIQSIWFTRDGGNVSKTGGIIITLDGKEVLNAPLQKVVDGELGAPFAFPFVANASKSSGGVVIKVPMPFRESMNVTVENNPLFYHVSYRTFPDSEGVETFDPKNPATDVMEQWRHAGTRDPKKPLPGATKQTKQISLSAGQALAAAELTGPQLISELRIRIPQLKGAKPGPDLTEDGRAFSEGGSSEFTVKVDPAHEAVRVTRRFDDRVEMQHARLLVDGEAVAEWPPLANVQRRQWRDQAVELPAAATKGKSSLRLRNEFISSRGKDFNEFTYTVESRVNGDWKETDKVDVGPASIESEKAHDYRISGATWEGEQTLRDSLVGDEKVIAMSDDILSATRLRITFDGNTTVDSPLGEFFGSALGEYEIRSLMYGMDTSDEGWYSSWWPMPFGKSAKIELVNDSQHDIQSAEVEVTSAKAEIAAPVSWFRTTTHRGMTEPGKDWMFLEAKQGPGKFVGVTHTMNRDRDRGYLEGDERVYVDGESEPRMHGTGTEDFYEGGWYFNQETFNLPTHGNPVHETDEMGTTGDATGCYRLMIGDQVPFSKSLRFSIEHGPANDWQAWYSSTSYWYSPAGDAKKN